MFARNILGLTISSMESRVLLDVIPNKNDVLVELILSSRCCQPWSRYFPQWVEKQSVDQRINVYSSRATTTARRPNLMLCES